MGDIIATIVIVIVAVLAVIIGIVRRSAVGYSCEAEQGPDGHPYGCPNMGCCDHCDANPYRK